jgi:hypothetical protein
MKDLNHYLNEQENLEVNESKITDVSNDAFLNLETFKSGNTKVTVNGNTATLSLHGNDIARNTNGKIEVTNAGWFSKTTKERLNGIPGVSIQQKAGKWFLNGEEWDGEWKEI